jgi:hypothetical protein
MISVVLRLYICKIIPKKENNRFGLTESLAIIIFFIFLRKKMNAKKVQIHLGASDLERVATLGGNNGG